MGAGTVLSSKTAFEKSVERLIVSMKGVVCLQWNAKTVFVEKTKSPPGGRKMFLVLFLLTWIECNR